jgi:hypothetical protein
LKKKLQLLYTKGQLGKKKKKQLDQRLRDGGHLKKKVTSNQRLRGLIHLKEKITTGSQARHGVHLERKHYNKAKC